MDIEVSLLGARHFGAQKMEEFDHSRLKSDSGHRNKVDNIKTSYKVVAARDIDVLLFLVAHFDGVSCKKLFMKAGTSPTPKIFPAQDIQKTISSEQLWSVLAFHAITGCNSTSQLSGVSKKTA